MKNTKQTNYLAVGIAIGTAIGAAIGIGMGNPGIGISVGIAIGAFTDYARQKRARNLRSINDVLFWELKSPLLFKEGI